MIVIEELKSAGDHLEPEGRFLAFYVAPKIQPCLEIWRPVRTHEHSHEKADRQDGMHSPATQVTENVSTAESACSEDQQHEFSPTFKFDLANHVLREKLKGSFATDFDCDEPTDLLEL